MPHDRRGVVAGALWHDLQPVAAGVLDDGDDVISAGAGDDDVDGGTGRDVVDGGTDEDRCDAERTTACERR